jgi:hypothetical protein
MWFHRTFRADGWLLCAQESPVAYGARGLARGQVFTAEGQLIDLDSDRRHSAPARNLPGVSHMLSELVGVAGFEPAASSSRT